MVQQKSLISGLKASSTTIDECQSHVKDTLGNLIKIEVETELCETNCETEIVVKCEENNDARRRRAAKKLYDVSLEIIIQQESEPEIISIKDENETGFEEPLVPIIDTDTILKTTMKILEEIEASDENDALVKIESSGQVLISSEPIEEISSALDPQLVFQEIESEVEVTTSNAHDDQENGDDQDENNGDADDDDTPVDKSLLLKVQTENEDLKVKLTLVEENFDAMKSNYDSIK